MPHFLSLSRTYRCLSIDGRYTQPTGSAQELVVGDVDEFFVFPPVWKNPSLHYNEDLFCTYIIYIKRQVISALTIAYARSQRRHM